MTLLHQLKIEGGVNYPNFSWSQGQNLAGLSTQTEMFPANTSIQLYQAPRLLLPPIAHTQSPPGYNEIYKDLTL